MRKKHFNENGLHEQVAKYLDLTGLLWFHPPNGGYRRRLEAIRLKRMGVKAGVPDVIILSPTRTDVWHPGVAIELKTKSGRLSKSQISWKLKLEREGWIYGVCRSLPDVIKIIEMHYFDRVKIKSKEAK